MRYLLWLLPGKARAKLAFGSIIPSRQGARAQVLRVFAVDGPAVAQDGSAADDLPQPCCPAEGIGLVRLGRHRS
ncbi:hypothetical protein VB636_09915, partial [Paracoccus sp. APAP_BH8]|uniref:hypothetical protein n=1 Tax=Paracoccus sp. APAP_BH8 TaxID=3110237 RepID=UPI002FD7D3CD